MTKQKKQPNRYLIFAVVYIACMFSSYNLLKVGPVLSLLIEDFRISSSLAGFIVSCSSIAGMLLVFPSASIIKRFGAKQVGLASLLMFMLGNLIGALSPNLPILMLARVVEGFGMGVAGMTSSTLVRAHFSGKELKPAMAVWSTWFAVGGGLAAMLSSKIASVYGNWKSVWWCSVIIMAVMFVLYALIVRNGDEPEARDDSEGERLPMYRVGLKNARVWLMGLYMGIIEMSVISVLSWATKFYTSRYGMEYAAAGALGSLGYWFNIVGGLVAGVVVGIVKTKGPEDTRYDRIALIVCAVLALGVFPLGFILPQSLAVPYLAAIGILFGYVSAVMFGVLPRFVKAPSLTGVAFAVLFFSQNFGSFIANPVMGKAIGDSFIWSNAVPLQICIHVILLICSVLICVLKPTPLKLPDKKA